MTALEHFREGQRLLAQSQRRPAMQIEMEDIPAYALLAAQAEAHFRAARTLIQAVSTLDLPGHEYAEWERLARGEAAQPYSDVAAFENCEHDPEVGP